MLYSWPPALPIASESEPCVSSNFKRDSQSHTFCSLECVQSGTFCYVLAAHSAEGLALKHATLFLVRVMHFHVLQIICSLMFSIRWTATDLLKTTWLYRLKKGCAGWFLPSVDWWIQFLIRSLYPMHMVNRARHIGLRFPKELLPNISYSAHYCSLFTTFRTKIRKSTVQ